MTLFNEPVQVTLTNDERDTFMRAPEGDGGWQIFLSELQSRVQGNTLTADDDELIRANRYAYHYGGGGFENRFRALIKAAVRAGWDNPA